MASYIKEEPGEFMDRKIVGELKSKQVTLVDLGNDVLGFKADNGDRYLPVNIDFTSLKVGDSFIISAEIKEVSVTELWAAQPIVVKKTEEAGI